jgi:lia operon protein LiaG
MKTAKIVRLVCWSIVAVFLISLLVVEIVKRDKFNEGIFPLFDGSGFTWGIRLFGGSGRGAGRDNDAEGYVEGDKYHVPVDEIDSIEVEWISGRINIEPYDGEEIVFSEKAFRELRSDERLVYEVRNDTLYIKTLEKKGVAFFSNDGISKDLTVNIPAELAEKLDDLQVSSVSGDIKINDLKSGRFFVETTSGKIEMCGFVSDEVGITSTSGLVNLDGKCDDIKIATVSGNINVLADSRPQKITMVTVSGDVELNIPENDGFDVSFDTVSGSFSCDFPIVMNRDGGTYKDGGASITLETVSGNLRIKNSTD